MRYFHWTLIALFVCWNGSWGAEEVIPNLPASSPSVLTPSPSAANKEQAKPAGPWSSSEALHQQTVDSFVNSMDLGISRIYRPNWELAAWVKKIIGGEVLVEQQSYLIQGIQLVGIAKHDPPVVHQHPIHSRFPTAVPDNKPIQLEIPEQTKQQIRQITKKIDPLRLGTEPRKLTEKEQEIMKSFRQGEEKSLVESDGQVHLYGPIRATESCLKCHEGHKTGDVLGALIYHLERK